MTALLQPVEPMDQAAPVRRYRSDDELAIRDALEPWGRSRWPEARCCHELVMNRGTARADMAFVAPRHLVSIEIKSAWDTTERLIPQIAMFRLATPECWVVVDQRHGRDADLVHWLLPTIGVALALREGDRRGPFRIEVQREPASFVPHPEAMLSLLWVRELLAEATASRLIQRRSSKPPSHRVLIDFMLRLDPAEQLAAVCRQLRARTALWRADPPVPPQYV